MSEGVRDDILQSILDDLREIGLSDTANYIQGLEKSIADYKRLVRELDVAINGDGAAKQASLCDIVGQVREMRLKGLIVDDCPLGA